MRIVLTLSLVLLASFAQAADLRFATEPYPPYGFIGDDGQPKGSAVEQVRAIMDSLAQPPSYSIEIIPWARALALTEEVSNHCAFLAARTSEREQRFRWVTPLSVDINHLVARTDRNISARSLEEARDLAVGAQRDDYTVGLLQAQNFRNLDLSASFDLTLSKLLSGRIDAMPMVQTVLEKQMAAGVPIRSIAVLSRQQLGIACNRQVPEAMIEKMQAALDRLRISGEQDRIRRQYGLPPLP